MPVVPATARRKPEKLPPLASRKTRVALLLSSYNDACEEAKETSEVESAHGPAESREPRRNVPLWREGSYGPLEDALDELRQVARPVYRAVRVVHLHNLHFRRYLAPTMAASERATIETRAKAGLAMLAMAMPQNIYVPEDISQNGGYEPSEARQYARRRA